MVKSTVHVITYILLLDTCSSCHDIIYPPNIQNSMSEESLGACSMECARVHICTCCSIEIEMCRERGSMIHLRNRYNFIRVLRCKTESICESPKAFGLRAEASSSSSRVIGHHLSRQKQWCWQIDCWDSDFLWQTECWVFSWLEYAPAPLDLIKLNLQKQMIQQSN